MPRVEIDQQVFERIEIVCPRYLSPTGFINLLLEQHVDRVATLGAEQSEAPSKAVISSKEEEIKPKKKDHASVPAPKFVFSVPPDLDFCKADLLEFWKEHKGGKKSRRAATVLIGGIRAIRDAYGEKAVNEQLELACAYGWENITLANYEKFGLKQAKPMAKGEPVGNHPAYRPASEVLAEQKRIEEQNLAHLRAKQQERDEIAAGRGVLNQIFDENF